MINKNRSRLITYLKTQNKEIKSKKLFYLILFLPIFLFFVLLCLFLFSVSLREEIAVKKINQVGLSAKPALYPVLNSNLDLQSLKISAQGYIVLDNDSKVILASKNPHLRFSMASTTKIMTALTSLNYFKMSDILTIKESKVEGSVVGFKKNEKVLFQDLLYAMLLPSANDAALAIAQNYPGGEKEFVKKMNENITLYNLKTMHFSDPAGLDDNNDYTTVLDLARLASIAMENKTFAKIVASKSTVIKNVAGTKTYSLTNLNKLLGEDGVNGIKTGFTEEAEGVLVTSKLENNHTIIMVVMKSKDRFADTEKLLSVVNNNIIYRNFNF